MFPSMIEAGILSLGISK